MRKLCAAFVLMSFVFNASAQTVGPSVKSKRWFDFSDSFHRNRVYFYWGYNREKFSKTDIHFHGQGYDFTIYGATAHDRPSPFTFHDYINPGYVTVPQYNFHVGYYMKHNLHVSFGNDHMKYVLTQYQTVKLSGAIDSSASQEFAGSYFNVDKVLVPQFLRFEHTNGLNLYTLNLEYLLPVFHTPNNKLRIGLNTGIGGIWVVTKTDVKVIGFGLDNDFHIAGFTVPLSIGPRVEIGKHFFVSAEIKAGYMHLPWVLIKNNAVDLADHNFTFLERYTVVGLSFPLNAKRPAPRSLNP